VPDLPRGQEVDRSSLLEVESYDLAVDLTCGAETFSSRAEVRFRCHQPGSATFADLEAAGVRRALLNGAGLDITRAHQPGRLELPQLAAENTLVVEAEFCYATAGAGLHRLTGPDGFACTYSKAYPGGAQRIYCCFDQPDLRAPFTVSVHVPAGWSCVANGPVLSRPADGEMGVWKFAATSPIAPYLSSFCAGPFSGPAFLCEDDGHRVRVTANALPAAAAALDAAALPELVRQPLRYYQQNLGVPYPYGKCDLVFVPGYPGLAFGAPGLITIKEQVLTEPPQGDPLLYRAIVIAHELAHAWFGGLIQLQPSTDGWLEEAITAYISRTALEETCPSATPWAELVSATLPDHAYASDAETIRQLEVLIGRQALLTGLGTLLRRHAHGHATKDDLVQDLSRAARRDLRQYAADTLSPTAKTSEQKTP
jgi:aminopeptidase N